MCVNVLSVPGQAVVDGDGTPASPEVTEDVAAIAQDLDLPPDEVAQQLIYQELLDTIPFEELDPGFAEVSGAVGENFEVVYASKAGATKPIEAALANAGLLKFTTFEKVPSSAAELADTHNRVHKALKETGIVAGTARNGFPSRITVITRTPVPAEKRVEIENVAAGTHIDWQIGELGADNAEYGGYGLTPECTAGFVVEKISTGNRGLSTAGHCANQLSHPGAGGLEFKGQHWYGHGDVQWHDKGGVTWGARVYDGSGTRAITSRKHWSDMDEMDQVVKYGKTTGFTTGHIIELFYCPPWMDSCEPTYVLTVRNGGGDMSAGGDSGGPVMLNGTALGYVKGNPGSPNDHLMAFMPQNFTQDVLGVRVLTQ